MRPGGVPQRRQHAARSPARWPTRSRRSSSASSPRDGRATTTTAAWRRTPRCASATRRGWAPRRRRLAADVDERRGRPRPRGPRPGAGRRDRDERRGASRASSVRCGAARRRRGVDDPRRAVRRDGERGRPPDKARGLLARELAVGVARPARARRRRRARAARRRPGRRCRPGRRRGARLRVLLRARARSGCAARSARECCGWRPSGGSAWLRSHRRTSTSRTLRRRSTRRRGRTAVPTTPSSSAWRRPPARSRRTTCWRSHGWDAVHARARGLAAALADDLREHGREVLPRVGDDAGRVAQRRLRGRAGASQGRRAWWRGRSRTAASCGRRSGRGTTSRTWSGCSARSDGAADRSHPCTVTPSRANRLPHPLRPRRRRPVGTPTRRATASAIGTAHVGPTRRRAPRRHRLRSQPGSRDCRGRSGGSPRAQGSWSSDRSARGREPSGSCR